MEEEHKDRFILKAPYKPTGDQPEAIAQLTDGLLKGDKCQTLLGVTGSGKTFTMANVIANLNRPTLVLAHNKTLAAQLCTEFKEFFPDNAVEYFVSYYDYYQPEAYIPSTDTYIEKDSAINEELSLIHISEPTRQAEISYAVFCLKKKKKTDTKTKKTKKEKKKKEAIRAQQKGD